MITFLKYLLLIPLAYALIVVLSLFGAVGEVEVALVLVLVLAGALLIARRERTSH